MPHIIIKSENINYFIDIISPRFTIKPVERERERECGVALLLPKLI